MTSFEILAELVKWESDPDAYMGDLADLARKAKALIEPPKVTVVIDWTNASLGVYSENPDAPVSLIIASDPEQRFNEAAEAKLVEQSQHLIAADSI